MTEVRTLLVEARDLIEEVREAHLSGFTLDSEDLAKLELFLDRSSSFV